MKFKHIKRAFEYLGYECPESIKSESDLNLEIQDNKQAYYSLEVAIEQAKEHLIKLKDYLDLLENAKQQVKAEEYRDQNPKAKDVFFIN